MDHTNSRYHPRRVTVPGALILAAALLAPAASALAGSDALLAVHLSPVEADQLALREVLVRLDGREVPLQLPSLVELREEPLVEVPTSSGPHTVDVEVRLDGHSDVFTYLQPYRFTLRGHLDLHVHAGELVAVRVAVVRTAGAFLRWEERHRLSFAATAYSTERAGAIPPPIPDPPPVQDVPPLPAPVATPAPASAPAPIPAPAPAAAAACSLEPVHFDFDQTALAPEGRRSLDRLAACLGSARHVLRVEGHCDLVGSPEANQLRGQQRADEVVKYLRERVPATVRFTAVSLSNSRPLCAEVTEACRARNRRAEAILEE